MRQRRLIKMHIKEYLNRSQLCKWSNNNKKFTQQFIKFLGISWIPLGIFNRRRASQWGLERECFGGNLFLFGEESEKVEDFDEKEQKQTYFSADVDLDGPCKWSEKR